MDCIIFVAKTKTLISCAVVTLQLMCDFVFANAKKQVFSLRGLNVGQLSRPYCTITVLSLTSTLQLQILSQALGREN